MRGLDEGIQYNSTDKNPFYGISYYRLRIVDLDGSYRYSKIVSVNIDADVKSDIAVFPNPVSHNNVWVSGLPAGAYQYSVHDLRGRVRFQENARLANEGETVVLPLKPDLTPGVYVIQFFNTNTKRNSTLKIVVR
jgi:hypothetical protein